MGITGHVEATGKDADVGIIGPDLMSTPPQQSPISLQEHPQMSSLPEERPVERPMERPMERLIETSV